MIRGMTIDEAIRQMRFVAKKGAGFILETLLEAQELAVKQHNVEFKSNLWVGEYKFIHILQISNLKILKCWIFSFKICVFFPQPNHSQAKES